MTAALCFVLMPHGTKVTGNATSVDFERVYHELFAPAIRTAGLEPFRAEDEQFAGPARIPAIERLVLCQSAIVDVTCANENVLYQLGVRQAARPSGTLCAFAEGCAPRALHTDVLDAFSYRIARGGAPTETGAISGSISDRLRNTARASSGIPLLTLLEDYPHVAHEKTDVFLQSVAIGKRHRDALARCAELPVEEAKDELREYESTLGSVADVESAVVVGLFLAYRDIQSYEDMLRLAHTMPNPLARTLLVQEQYAFALNRLGRNDEAEALLEHVLATRGPSSETYALLGRVFKDRYDAATKSADDTVASLWLRRAGEAYLKGFEADSRDEYPGVNALTLLAIDDRNDPRIAELLPAVRYSARRRVAAGKAGYWSHAALTELAVLADDESDANAELVCALSHRPEAWKLASTARNLRLLQRAGVAPAWVENILHKLERGAEAGG